MIIKYDVIRYDNKVIIRWKKKILTQIENWTFFFTYLFIFMFDVWHNNTEDLKKIKLNTNLLPKPFIQQLRTIQHLSQEIFNAP